MRLSRYNQQQITDKVKEVFDKGSYSQTELSKIIGMNESQLSKCLKGKLPWPKNRLKDIIGVYGLEYFTNLNIPFKIDEEEESQFIGGRNIISEGGMLKILRDIYNLTQIELANKAGIKLGQQISAVETGHRNLGRILGGKIANALGLSMDEFWKIIRSQGDPDIIKLMIKPYLSQDDDNKIIFEKILQRLHQHEAKIDNEIDNENDKNNDNNNESIVLLSKISKVYKLITDKNLDPRILQSFENLIDGFIKILEKN